ncbi:MAG: vanadium-dependent haloperoxidase [Actinomycetota bacterium]|nr:vanadium-dependent haloperoxidase [Actinomycetota bacterium]
MNVLRPATAALILALLIGGCGSSKDDKAPLGSEASAGTWKTWVLSSPSEIPVPAPPAAGSAAAKRDQQEMRTALSNRTAAQAQSAEPVVQPWLSRAMTLVSQREKNPPRASRAYGIVSVAMYDAAVAAAYWKHRYEKQASGGNLKSSYPSEEAAVAGAGSRVVAYAFPEASKAGLDTAAADAAQARVAAGMSTPAGAKAGLDLGRAVADRVIARAKTDGSTRVWNGKRPPHTPAYWDPPAGSLARPVEPLAGTWRTWLMRSGSQFRAPPPPAYGSAQFLKEARQLVAIRANLTPKQKGIAAFWAGGQGTPLPPGVWNQVMFSYLRGTHLNVPSQTRVFALLNVAMDDAGVASWDTKFTYWNPRPQNAIRALGLDRRWTSYIATPFFPAYVSGHSTYSSAAAEVLAHLFPKDARLWRDKGREAGYSRLLGGIHWNSDNVYGTRLGLAIGRLAVRHAEHDGAEK